MATCPHDKILDNRVSQGYIFVFTGKDGLPVKKIIAILLMVGMLFTVGFSTVGCSKDKEKKKEDGTPPKEKKEKGTT